MRWRKGYPKKDGDIVYTIRKNCRFCYVYTYDTFGNSDFVPLEEDDIRFNKGKKLYTLAGNGTKKRYKEIILQEYYVSV